ncbi:MAG TPA: flagellar motor protein MotB [Kofleriaceae bacterium]|jgi:chemotaxis protein MotB
MARRIKKVEGGHGHHGGAWKVAYADFVTAMMALFMVMWLLASTDQQTRQEISNYFRTGILPDGDMAMNHAAQAKPSVFQVSSIPPPPGTETIDDRETARALTDRLNRLAALDPGLAQVMRNVHVQVTGDGILIEAVDESKGLLFDVASARLNEPLERFLRALGPALSALDRQIEINGHTDARPFVAGARLSNWDLSYQRAEAAREILEASGVAPRQISGVFARGASQLYIPSDPLSPQNRRLSILVKIARPGTTKLATTEQAEDK